MNKGSAAAGAPKKSCLSEIQRLQKDRDERRRAMEQAKVDKATEEQRNRDSGISGDVDFTRMIKQFREKSAPEEVVHLPSAESKIAVCVRKRPISVKETNRNDNDCITCSNPVVIVHDCKLRVDGISKYLDNSTFEFDHTFHEENTTDNIYDCAIQHLVEFVLQGGRATVFAYGQTGSGKTFTMQGIQSFVADDLFYLLQQYEEESGTQVIVYVSYFEIYGGRCQDLLNSRQRLNVREDGAGEVIVSELMEMRAESVDALHGIIETGNRNRTTHATESNDESSRSHAICQISLRSVHPKSGNETLIGRFSLIDLAGSERGADTKSHNRQRRMEGAEINKSLLALKECIRALDSGSNHVPYRASKLTLVLKDSFINKRSKTVMIVNVSPAASSADHTLNTLRYADRIKERAVGGQAAKNNAAAERAAAAVVAPSPPVANINQQQQQPRDRNSRNKEISKALLLAENNNNNNMAAASPKISSSASAPSSAAADAKRQRSQPGAAAAQYKDSRSPPVSVPTGAAAAAISGNNYDNVKPRRAVSGIAAPNANNKFIPAKKGSSNNYDEEDDDVDDFDLHRRHSNGDIPVTRARIANNNSNNNNNSSHHHRKGSDHQEFDDNDYDYDDGDEFNAYDDDDDNDDAFHRTVQDVFDEEEALLNLHMLVIQENAELLTEEGRLLQQIQGENNDIDAYAARLDIILQRKQELIKDLRQSLDHFRSSLQKEEIESKRMASKAVSGNNNNSRKGSNNNIGVAAPAPSARRGNGR